MDPVLKILITDTDSNTNRQEVNMGTQRLGLGLLTSAKWY